MWISDLIPLSVAFVVAAISWRVGVHVLRQMDGPALHSVAASDDPERLLRLAQARARRLRTVRYAEEHNVWTAQFEALGGACPDCGVPVRRGARAHG